MAAGKHNTRLSITCGKYICVTWRLCWARKNAFPLVMGRGFTKVAVTGVSRGSRNGTRPCLCPWFLVLQCEEPYKWAGEEDWGTWTDVNLASAFQITRFDHYLPVSLILKNEMWGFLGRFICTLRKNTRIWTMAGKRVHTFKHCAEFELTTLAWSDFLVWPRTYVPVSQWKSRYSSISSCTGTISNTSHISLKFGMWSQYQVYFISICITTINPNFKRNSNPQ